MITTRNDIVTAKTLLDNLDLLTAAIASLKQQAGGTVMVSVVTPTFKFTFDVADLLTFLQAQQVKITDQLAAFGVASVA